MLPAFEGFKLPVFQQFKLPASPKSMADRDIANLTALLPLYYQRLFPFHDYWRWLSYGDKTLFDRREFSFTIFDDVFVRNRSFEDEDDMKLECRRLVPHKIDIGAIYNHRPIDGCQLRDFTAVQRELVFDIDMSEYDDVRSCCAGAVVCQKCWKFMVIACTIIDRALREDFGYQHLLWVFSGRRGIHCWVCDKSARVLGTWSRNAVVAYLQLLTGNKCKAKKVYFPAKGLHSSVKRALNIIKPMFVSMCVEEQDMLGTENAISKFLAILIDDAMRTQVRELFSKCSSSLERWEAFVAYHRTELSVKERSPYLMEEIMLQYAYPRLDILVSKSMNHLLKSPFSIHPKSGKISVPFHPKAVAEFNVENAPTLELLINEINAYDKTESFLQGKHTRRKVTDYKNTSLNTAIDVFREFLKNLEDSMKR